MPTELKSLESCNAFRNPGKNKTVAWGRQFHRIQNWYYLSLKLFQGQSSVFFYADLRHHRH